MDQSGLSASKHFTLHPLGEHILAAIAEDSGAAISNSGLLELGGQSIVFDTFMTPQAAQDLRRCAEEWLGRPPQIAVNSHYHNDHIWGNPVFLPEAQLVSSAHTRQQIATAGMEELQWYTANAPRLQESFQAQYQAAADEESRKQAKLTRDYYAGMVEALPQLKVCLPGIVFNHRLEIHGDHLAAQLMAFEGGHSGSDTVLYVPQEGVVFMSDLLFVGCHPYLADGDVSQLRKALEELSRLDAATFVPGHGAVGTRDDIAILLEYIDECTAAAQALVKAGEPSEARIAQQKVPARYASWTFPQFYLDNLRYLCKRSLRGDV